MSILHARHPNQEFAERPMLDHYPTPYPLCEKALKLIPLHPGMLYTDSIYILDPGAGTGVWGSAARGLWANAYIDGVEIDPRFPKNPAYNGWGRTDFLKSVPTPLYHLVIGNPPYGRNIEGKTDRKMAEKFVRHGMACLQPGGYLMYLMLLNFITTANRVNGLFKDYPLLEVIPLVQRPSFKPGKKGGKNDVDMREYGIFLWRKGNIIPQIRYLDWKPENVRRSSKSTKPRSAVAENNS